MKATTLTGTELALARQTEVDPNSIYYADGEYCIHGMGAYQWRHMLCEHSTDIGCREQMIADLLDGLTTRLARR